MHIHPGWLVLAGVAMATLPQPARSAESYDSCTGFIDALPATVASQGTWCLRSDLATSISSGNAITIGSNNITIDCNGFRIGGLSAGTGTATNGIASSNRANTTVRNCNIRGFARGVSLDGLGVVVEDNRFDGNTYVGIQLGSRDGLVRRNQVLDTGGSTNPSDLAYAGAYGIYASGRIDLLDNNVNGVAPTPTEFGAFAYGLLVSHNDTGSISGNHVAGLFATGDNAVSTGIDLRNEQSPHPGRPTVTNNTVVGTGAEETAIGIRCEVAGPRLRSNSIVRMQVGLTLACDAGGNVFAP